MMGRSLTGRLQQDRNAVDRARRQLEAGLPDIGTLRRRIDDQSRIAATAVASLAKQRRLEVDGVYQRLRGLDPQATLSRGFAIVELAVSGQALTSAGQAKDGDKLTITVSDGAVPAVVGIPAESSEPPQAPASPAVAHSRRERKAKPPPASAKLL